MSIIRLASRSASCSCLMLFSSLVLVSTLASGGEMPWKSDCDTVVQNARGHEGGWAVSDPPSVALTVRDGVLSFREVGARSYAGTHSYVSYDLDAAPYLKIKVLDGDGRVTVGNASTGGRAFVSKLHGPALYSVDLRDMYINTSYNQSDTISSIFYCPVHLTSLKGDTSGSSLGQFGFPSLVQPQSRASSS